MKPRVKDWTYYSEVHNFEDPDGESEVDHYEDHEEEDKEVKATFPPAVDPHFIQLRFFSTLDIVPMRALFLGHLEEDTNKTLIEDFVRGIERNNIYIYINY